MGAAILWSGRRRLGPFRITRVLLNSPDVPGLGCEHNDVLCLPEHRSAVLTDLVDLLLRSQADEVSLVGVREHLLEDLRSLWPRVAWEGYRSESPFVDLRQLRSEGLEYMETLSSSTRAQIRRSVRVDSERFGALDLAVAPDAATAQSWFKGLLRLHDRRWSGGDASSGFAPEARLFHSDLIRDFTSEARPTEGLRTEIIHVRFGDETLGYLYHLAHRGHLHFVQSGLRYTDDNRLKPGLVSHALSIQHCLARGDVSYDLLGGEPEPVRYKRALAHSREYLWWAAFPAPTRRMDAIARLRSLVRKYWKGPD